MAIEMFVLAKNASGLPFTGRACLLLLLPESKRHIWCRGRLILFQPFCSSKLTDMGLLGSGVGVGVGVGPTGVAVGYRITRVGDGIGVEITVAVGAGTLPLASHTKHAGPLMGVAVGVAVGSGVGVGVAVGGT